MVDEGEYSVFLHLKDDGKVTGLGNLRIKDSVVSLVDGSCSEIENKLAKILAADAATPLVLNSVVRNGYQFHFDDGIVAVGKMKDLSIDLLLTDPPYSISKSYVCESQIPRRLRKNGSDFIMPKGNFGEWDNSFPPPQEWTSVVLPKVKGWAVIFCAQSQIGEYCQILEKQKFVAITPMVWHKTNPVPFNHKFKPLNAWEALVVGKRSGSKFNGRVVHNVFTHKSPSPQDRIHSTQKPEGLLSEFVRLFSNEGGLVVDPFAGSGSTIVAAVWEGRTAMGYENDPSMFDKARNRIVQKMGILN